MTIHRGSTVPTFQETRENIRPHSCSRRSNVICSSLSPNLGKLFFGNEGIIDRIFRLHPMLSTLSITIWTFLLVIVLRSPPNHMAFVEILLNNTTHRGFADPVSLNVFRLITKLFDT